MPLAIQARRWSPGFTDEGALVPGELLWDDTAGRLGVFGGDATIHWYPAVKPKIVEYADATVLRSRSSNSLELLFTGTDIVIRTRAGATIAQFSAAGVSLANAAVVGMYPAGSGNDVINGAFQCLRSDVITPTTVSNTARRFLVAPNWLAWAGAVGTSELRLQWSTDAPPLTGAQRSLSVQVRGTGIPADAGIRTFVHDANRLRSGNTVTVWAKGPNQAATSVRVITAGGVARYEVIYGTGAWKAYPVTLTAAEVATATDWLALDALYCPQIGPNNSGDTWLLGAVEWNAGTSPGKFALPTAIQEQARVNTVYAEPLMRGESVSWSLIPQYTQLFDPPSPVSEFDHTGASYQNSYPARLVAARLPPVPVV